MLIIDRYAQAINSTNLISKERTLHSDSDILGAYGFAAKSDPLAAALERCIAGDPNAATKAASLLAGYAWCRGRKINLSRIDALKIARACLAWHKNGVCKVCNGRGKIVIPDTPVLSSIECGSCLGQGKIPFDRQFDDKTIDIAKYLSNLIERRLNSASYMAVKKLGR